MATDPIPIKRPARVDIDCDQLQPPNDSHIVYTDQQVRWHSGHGKGYVINFEESPFEGDEFHVPKGTKNGACSGPVTGGPKTYKYNVTYHDGTTIDPELDIRR